MNKTKVYQVKVERHSIATWTVRAKNRDDAMRIADELGTVDDYAYDTQIKDETEDVGQVVDGE